MDKQPSPADTVAKAAQHGYIAINNFDKEEDIAIRAAGYRKLALEAIYALSILEHVLRDHEEMQQKILEQINAS